MALWTGAYAQNSLRHLRYLDDWSHMSNYEPKYIPPYIDDAIRQAHKEIAAERFRVLVEAHKIYLRDRPKCWWHPFVPFVITIKRRQ